MPDVDDNLMNGAGFVNGVQRHELMNDQPANAALPDFGGLVLQPFGGPESWIVGGHPGTVGQFATRLIYPPQSAGA